MALEVTVSGGGAPRFLSRFPWNAAVPAVLIAALGVWNLASASRTAPSPVWVAQLWWMGAGAAVALVAVLLDDRSWLRLAYVFYGAVVLLLLLVLWKGRWVMGARRWLSLGPVSFQPSELAKIAVALALARWFHMDAAKRTGSYGIRGLAVPIGLTLLPALLVLRQPDLGTALVVVAVGATVILLAGVRIRTITGLLGTLALAAVLVWPHLKPYQRKRVESFLNPEGDALGAGYHATQSMIAVGSGQGTGKGWGQGTQTALRFLPEQHTDFIFSVWAEEHGFLGCLLLVGLYLALVWAGLNVAGHARDRFGHFLAVGVTGMFFWQAAVNMGMVVGLLPVVGVPLPLMSYGGSAVVTAFLGLGLLTNVAVRRFVN
jgi:rod shape determining protein RodA